MSASTRTFQRRRHGARPAAMADRVRAAGTHGYAEDRRAQRGLPMTLLHAPFFCRILPEHPRASRGRLVATEPSGTTPGARLDDRTAPESPTRRPAGDSRDRAPPRSTLAPAP